MSKTTMRKTSESNGATPDRYERTNDETDRDIPYADVGDTVVVYFGGPGNVNANATAAGLVVARRDAEILELSVARAGYNGVVSYRMAYHVNSATIEENPRLCAKEGVCLWDTVERHRQRRYDAEQASRARRIRDEEANEKRLEARREMRKSVESRVLAMYAKNMNYAEISEAIGGGLTPNEVETILRRATQERAVAV
jgi:hypothetical protein